MRTACSILTRLVPSDTERAHFHLHILRARPYVFGPPPAFARVHFHVVGISRHLGPSVVRGVLVVADAAARSAGLDPVIRKRTKESTHATPCTRDSKQALLLVHLENGYFPLVAPCGAEGDTRRVRRECDWATIVQDADESVSSAEGRLAAAGCPLVGAPSLVAPRTDSCNIGPGRFRPMGGKDAGTPRSGAGVGRICCSSSTVRRAFCRTDCTLRVSYSSSSLPIISS